MLEKIAPRSQVGTAQGVPETQETSNIPFLVQEPVADAACIDESIPPESDQLDKGTAGPSETPESQKPFYVDPKDKNDWDAM